MRAVLFDVDGVVLDSMTIYRRVWARWCLLVDLDPDTVWPLTHGRRPQDTIAMVAPHLAIDSEMRRLEAFLDKESSPVPAMPGAHELLTALPRRQWALVTSNSEPFVRSEFALLGLPWPSVIVDGGAVLEGKPSPQGFLAASARLGCAAAECLVVEDAEAGVEAGLAAGMTVLAIDPPPGGPRLATAHARFPSLEAASGAIRDWVLASDPAAEVP